jgi:hypothetical protein
VPFNFGLLVHTHFYPLLPSSGFCIIRVCISSSSSSSILVIQIRNERCAMNAVQQKPPHSTAVRMARDRAPVTKADAHSASSQLLFSPITRSREARRGVIADRETAFSDRSRRRERPRRRRSRSSTSTSQRPRRRKRRRWRGSSGGGSLLLL